MRRFLFVFVLLASSTALDAAFAKGGIYSLRVRLRLLNCRPQANFWLAAAMAATAIA
jgi:hypothetical protein